MHATAFSIKDIRLLKANYRLTPIEEIEINNDLNEESDIVDVKLNCTSFYEKEERNIRVILNAIVGNKHSPYSLDVEFGGAFELDSEPKENELDSLRNINCPAMVLPYLREFISEITRRGGHSPLYLPPVNFVKSAAKRIAHKK